MNRNTQIFIGVAVPTVFLLILAVVLITISLKTCVDSMNNKSNIVLCVSLNKKNESTGSYYKTGLHVINPTYHFSYYLPSKGYSMVGGVQTQNENIIDKNEQTNTSVRVELGVFLVFKYYIKEDNIFKFFEALPGNYSNDEYGISTAVAKNATPIVQEIIGRWTCNDYRNKLAELGDKTEEYWMGQYRDALNKSFIDNEFLFTLDEEKPIKAVFFFGGYCGYD